MPKPQWSTIDRSWQSWQEDDADIIDAEVIKPADLRRRSYRGDPAMAFCTMLCWRPALCAAANQAILETDEDCEVFLHVYDIVESGILRQANQWLQNLGTGAFHVGVEVYGWEWSFGDASSGTGVFYSKPKSCGERQYRESVWIGTTAFSAGEVDTIIRKMEKEWQGRSYDLLRRNCCHFCQALCKRLVKDGVVPPWISSLSGAGAAMQDGVAAAQRIMGLRGASNASEQILRPEHPLKLISL